VFSVMTMFRASHDMALKVHADSKAEIDTSVQKR